MKVKLQIMAAFNNTITITGAEYRPCYVDGKKGLFHRWVDKEQPIIKINNTYGDFNANHINIILDIYRDKSVLPPEADLKIHKDTFGIVEYSDGTVAEVAPTLIRFADNKLSEYAFCGSGRAQGSNVTDKHPVDEFICSECGFVMRDFSETVIDLDADDEYCREFYFRYCPRCGTKIESEGAKK